MRHEAAFFGDAELELLYMARRLDDALSLESELDTAGLDYLVETGTYTGGLLMPRELTGAFFYIQPADSPAAHAVLARTRRRPYKRD